jgi:hypothetical protein
MDKTPEPNRGRSVDLHNKSVPLDVYMREHGDITTNEGPSYATVNPGRSEAQEMLVALAEIAERSPRAVVVLLLTAVRRKTNSEAARIMRTTRRKVQYTRVWLRRHYTALSACCGKA